MNTVSPAVDLTSAAAASKPAFKWTVSQVEALYQLPLMDLLFRALSSLRAKPALYIGGEIEDSTAVYGFPKDWDVVIDYPFYVQCSIELEGLI